MNDNPNIESSESQCNQILAWLKSGHSLTALDALNRFKCFRLASRISDLKRRGYNIVKKMVKNEENGKHYAQYTIDTNESKD